MKENIFSIKQCGKVERILVEKRKINTNFSLHWHDFFEIEIVVLGSGEQILNGQKYTLERGCAYIISPSDFHEVKPKNELTLYNIGFRENMLSEKFLHMLYLKSGVFYFSEEELDEIILMCKVIEKEYKRERKYQNEFLKNMLECFLIMILRKTNNLRCSETNLHDMQKAVMYAKLHFKENPTLCETAFAVNLNPNYFSEKFKEYTKKNYNAYLTELKIDYAKKLLVSSNLNITEVCFASGFASISNFMRVFKKQTGVSPKTYRIENKESLRKNE